MKALYKKTKSKSRKECQVQFCSYFVSIRIVFLIIFINCYGISQNIKPIMLGGLRKLGRRILSGAILFFNFFWVYVEDDTDFIEKVIGKIKYFFYFFSLRQTIIRVRISIFFKVICSKFKIFYFII